MLLLVFAALSVPLLLRFYRFWVGLGRFFRFCGSFFRFFDASSFILHFLTIFFDFGSIFGGFGEVLGKILGGFFDEFLLDFRKRRFCKN